MYRKMNGGLVERGFRVAVLGVLGMILLPAGVAVGETQASGGRVFESTVNATQEATVLVDQQSGEGLDARIEAASGPDGSGSQNITVNSVQEDSVSETSGNVGSLDSAVVGAPAGNQVLPSEEKARIQNAPPASGQSKIPRQREIKIAREQIFARPVGNISKDRYKALYKSAAERYGFGEDWYVLAAVGWIESQHGGNMGPSSAGAMGPMQFLPSTWISSGVDGNGDGKRNIMDPEDAIPAAARYLKLGGAPGDWVAALYTYNHSETYVRDVLESAERYRKLAKDSSVGPYKPVAQPSR